MNYVIKIYESGVKTMTKIRIISILAAKGYQIKQDFNTSRGGNVYEYTESSGATKRLYIIESNIQNKAMWGMNTSIVKKLVSKPDNCMTILLSTANQEAYLISKNEMTNLYNGQFQLLSINKCGRFIITMNQMHKINSMHLTGNTAIANVINSL
jgi:hypothetical protein